MATAPPSPERLELGPGVFWLRSKVFHCCICPELSVTSLRGASASRLDEPGKEREGKGERRREGRDKKNPGVGRHWVGGGRKAKRITSLLEQSQKGKDMSQCTDCTSLPHLIEANPLVCEVPSTWAGVRICGDWGSILCVYVCVCGQTAGFVLHVRLSNSRGAHFERWGPEESHRGLTGHWTVVSAASLERNVAEHIREREKTHYRIQDLN